MRAIRGFSRTLPWVRGAAAMALGLGAVLGPAAGSATADDSPSASASAGDGSDAPTEAGTSFRTATAIKQDQEATASASSGDYLYWSFPADAGQRPTVKASVKLPESASSQAGSKWQIDVYDGLRRRQACMYGSQTRTVVDGASSVDLACTLRPVRAWSEAWADDPLPGTYYIRLTVVDAPASGLGFPVQASVDVEPHDVGGAHAVGGRLSEPLVPGVSVTTSDDDTATLSAGAPEDGWSSGWWTDRWLWTAAGAVLAALGGIGGYALTRGRGRPRYVPPHA